MFGGSALGSPLKIVRTFRKSHHLCDEGYKSVHSSHRLPFVVADLKKDPLKIILNDELAREFQDCEPFEQVAERLAVSLHDLRICMLSEFLYIPGFEEYRVWPTCDCRMVLLPWRQKRSEKRVRK